MLAAMTLVRAILYIKYMLHNAIELQLLIVRKEDSHTRGLQRVASEITRVQWTQVM